MSRLLALLALILALPAAAQNVGLDPRFGSDGMLSLRDPSAPNARQIGMSACAAPGGGLTVVAATADDRLAMFRLKLDGSLDTSFSGDGMTSIAVPPSNDDTVLGACMSDGRIVLARMAQGTGSDRNIQVMRVTPDGELDAAFGIGGTRVIDFDAYEPGLGDLEFVLGINLIAGNEILVTTRIFVGGNDSRPGIARLDASGNISYARIINVPGATVHYASGAGIGVDNRIWVVGGCNPTNTAYNTWFRAELDPATGATLESFVGNEGNYTVDSGRVLANGVMVALGKYVPQNEPGGAYRPRLLVFREGGTTTLTLPALNAVNDFEPTLSPFPGHAVVIPTTDGRVMVSAPMGGQNGQFDLATYVASAEVGASAAEDRVETRFGNNGAFQFHASAGAPCTNGSPPAQRITRASNWLGRPILVGFHATTCSTMPRNVMVARVLLRDDVFFDGFDD
jgi:hypothetical protein